MQQGSARGANRENDMDTYALIDSGNGRKLEQFGQFVISRPCAQAVWQPQLSEADWKKADAIFTRESENRWIRKERLLSNWETETAGIKFKISPTDFGHLGSFLNKKIFGSGFKLLSRKPNNPDAKRSKC